jgi:hypothetical protein
MWNRASLRNTAFPEPTMFTTLGSHNRATSFPILGVSMVFLTTNSQSPLPVCPTGKASKKSQPMKEEKPEV